MTLSTGQQTDIQQTQTRWEILPTKSLLQKIKKKKVNSELIIKSTHCFRESNVNNQQCLFQGKN